MTRRTTSAITVALGALAIAACGSAQAEPAAPEPAPGPAAEHLVLPDAASEGPPLEARAVLDAPHLKLLAIVLRDGTPLPEHTAPVPVTITAISGAGTVHADGQSLRVDPTHVVSLRPRVPHSVEPDPGTDLVLLVHQIRGAPAR